MTKAVSDVIDHLAGISPGSAIDLIRAKRSQTKTAAQENYRYLLEPADAGTFTAEDRFAVAYFVAALHGDEPATAFYAGLLEASISPELRAVIVAEAERAAAKGPYGRYPEGPLSAENVDGPVYSTSEDAEKLLGPWLSRGLEHAHLLVFHPRDANGAALQRLLDGGWSSDAIVTLSQLVSFLAFQIRAAAGLRALVKAPARIPETA